jgi:eukaryotic-like serine/threonine-protein kinase
VVESRNAFIDGAARGILAEVAWRRGDRAGALAAAEAACAAATPFPLFTVEVETLRVRLLLDAGDPVRAAAHADAAVARLEEMGATPAGEIGLRLAAAEAYDAAGRLADLPGAAAAALSALHRRAARIPEAAARERFLRAVPTHARLLALAGAWSGAGEAREP